jgi:O-antigen/teichoic acid export membrane protein
VSDGREFVTTVSESDAITPVEMPGLHAGAIVFLGIAAANVGNYAFHLISARTLGPSAYGDVASLVALAGLISLPLGGVQVIVARRVAASAAAGRTDEISAFARRTLTVASLTGLAFAALLLAASPLLADWLDIDSLTAVLLTAAFAAPAVLTPALWGLVQGLQEFRTLAVAMGVSPLFRVVAVAVLLAAGFGVAGAMGATLVAGIVGAAVPAWALRRWFAPAGPVAATRDWGSAVQEFAPGVLGLLAVTSLTTVDVVVAKAAFDSDDAGIYASASLVGRVILYLPAAIVTVLLPKVTSRVAVGKDPRAIVAGSIAVTLGFCLVATVVYTLGPSIVTRVAFGGGFEDVADLLPLFAISMTGFALLNVMLAYHLGRGSSSMSYLLAAGAVAQVVAFAAFHDSANQLLAVSIVVAAVLVVLHELLIEPTLVHSARLVAHVRPRRKP